MFSKSKKKSRIFLADFSFLYMHSRSQNERFLARYLAMRAAIYLESTPREKKWLNIIIIWYCSSDRCISLTSIQLHVYLASSVPEREFTPELGRLGNLHTVFPATDSHTERNLSTHLSDTRAVDEYILQRGLLWHP